MCFMVFQWTQPQRDVCGLHRLLHDSQQLLAQLVQVHFLAQGGAEGCHRLGGIIFAAVEAPINDPLDTLAQRSEQGCAGQGGDDDGHTGVLADEATQQRLQPNHQAHVNQGQ